MKDDNLYFSFISFSTHLNSKLDMSFHANFAHFDGNVGQGQSISENERSNS